MANNETTIYFNNKGEIIDPPVQAEQVVPCDNVIEFCVEAIVPDGFTFDVEGFNNFSFCSDVSGLACVLESVGVDASINNPCGGTLTCPVVIDAVRAVGCVRFHVNIGELVPNQEGINFGNSCTLCFDKTVCVNQVIGYTCTQDTCIEDCFTFNFAFVSFSSSEQLVDACGRQIVVIRGGLGVSFAGC